MNAKRSNQLPARRGPAPSRPLLPWLAPACLLTTLCAAQTEETAGPPVTLDPVEVFARGGDAAVFGPTAVTARDGAFLAANGIADYEDLATVTPGFFAANQSVDNVSLNIRGITSDSTDLRQPPRVSVFQDGVLLHNPRGSGVALFDLDEIAVFKGPQPTRFADGVQSGALAVSSNRARDESSGALSVGAGEFNAVEAEGFVNRPVVDGKLFARVAVYSKNRDGYTGNRAGGPALQDEGTRALRAGLRWQPAPGTTADLIFNLQDDDTAGTAFKTLRGVPGFPAVTDTDPYSAASLNRGSALGIERTLVNLTGILRHELGEDWTLTATSAWRSVDNRNEFDADGSPVYLLEPGERYEGRRLSQEVRLDHDADGPLTASLGVAVARSEDGQDTFIRTDENALFTYLTGGGISPFPLNPRYEERGRNEADATTADVFGRADYAITERLTLGAGLRLTHERLASRYQSFAAIVPGNLAGALPMSGGGNNFFQVTPGELENRDEVDAWSGQLDARYAVTPRHTAYASVARGRRSPVLGFDQLTLAPTKLAEETVLAFEVGVRGVVANDRVRYDAAVFQYEFDHFQTQRIVPPGIVQSFDGGRARGRGFELGVEADVSKALTLFATYGYTDARFSNLDEDGLPQAYAGDTFRLTSRHAASLGGTLTVPVDGAGAVFFTPLLTYRSEYYFEDNNAQNGGILRQGGFALLNLRLGYRAKSGQWEVVAHVDNALDKDYLLDAGNTGGTYGFPTAVRGAPHMAGVTATVRF